MKIKDYLSPDEIRAYTARSDLLAARTLLLTWLGIILIFAVVDAWTNPLTIVLAVILLSGRQLGLAVIEHECGHHTLFKTEALNRFCGQWLAAHPVFGDMYSYSRDHSDHHRLAGSESDPDLNNYKNYPVNRASFKRKVLRDLTGQTGYKLLRFVFSMAAGVFSQDAKKRSRARPFVAELAVNAVLAVAIALVFQPWMYLLWIASFMTTYMLIVRIRQVAEHAAVPDLYDPDPRNNTRTTIPGWWERLLFAPNQVNYHLEHHLMASAPCYRLPDLHRLLTERGAYDNTPIFYGYREVLSHTVAPA